MLRKQSLFVLGAAAIVFALVIWYGVRGSAPAAKASAPAAPASSAPPPTSSGPDASPAEAAAPGSQDVTRWITEAASADAAKRAAAIQALATAPRADALPTLRGILMHGEPQVDRKLALASLRELALEQGDADGAVRDAVRQAIYHGDDFMPADELQEALDVIEESELK